MDEEQPKKKITLSNFFESIQSVDETANRALKKTDSNLGVINNNKSLIEALSKSFDVIKTEIKEIKEYITIEKDLEKDKLFSQEDQEQKIRRLERLQGIKGDKVDPADAAAGTTDDSDFQKQASDTVKKALQDRGVMSIIVGLIGVNLASMLENKRSFFGGMADSATGNIFDFDDKGRGLTPILPEVKEKLPEKPRGYGRIFGGIADYIMKDTTDFDKRGGNQSQNLNLGGVVKDNDNDTSNNNKDSVPAMLTPGEFVVKKDAVNKIGVDTLKEINQGGLIGDGEQIVKKFNQGGLVEGMKKMYSSEIEENKSKNNLKPLLDMIGSGESDNVGGYSAMFPSESYPKMLDMTINEVIEFQKEKLKDGRKSVAVGRYQMLYPEDYAAAAGLPLTAKFTPSNQDKMVIAYLKKYRKLSEFIKGEITNEQFSEELAEEFGTFKSASGFVLPNNTGSIDFEMMMPVFNKIKNNLKSETKSSNNLQSVIESKSDQLAQNIFTPPTTQSNNVNLLPIPITQQSQPINGNVPVSSPLVSPQVSTTPVTSTMSTVSFINMISNKQLSVG